MSMLRCVEEHICCRAGRFTVAKTSHTERRLGDLKLREKKVHTDVLTLYKSVFGAAA